MNTGWQIQDKFLELHSQWVTPAFLTNFVTAVAENLMPYWFDPTGNQPQKTTHC